MRVFTLRVRMTFMLIVTLALLTGSVTASDSRPSAKLLVQQKGRMQNTTTRSTARSPPNVSRTNNIFSSSSSSLSILSALTTHTGARATADDSAAVTGTEGDGKTTVTHVPPSSLFSSRSSRSGSFVPKYSSSSRFATSSKTIASIAPPAGSASDSHPKSVLSNSPMASIAPMAPMALMFDASVCAAGHAEVAQEMNYGWKGTDNTGFGNTVADMVNDIANHESQGGASNNDFTASTQRGGLICRSWAGAMVSNDDTYQHLAGFMYDNLRSQDIPKGKYFEYISPDGNPMKGFGVYCQVNSDGNEAAIAIKGWSMGISAASYVPGISGTASFGRQSICYLDYAARKSGNADADTSLGDCAYARVGSGQTASAVCNNLSGDVLQLYNLHVDFNSLSSGQYICCSIGTFPQRFDQGSCNSGHTAIANQLSYAWSENTHTDEATITAVADVAQDLYSVISSYSNDFSDVSHSQSQSYSSSTACGIWIGAMISNQDTGANLINALKNDIETSGMTDEKMYEYSLGGPMKTVGIYCVVNGNMAAIESALKAWSMGTSAWKAPLTQLTGLSSLPQNTDICVVDYSARKSGNSGDFHVSANCEYAQIQSGKTASDACKGLTEDVLTTYNPQTDFSALDSGEYICCSIGRFPAALEEGTCAPLDQGAAVAKVAAPMQYGWKSPRSTTNKDGIAAVNNAISSAVNTMIAYTDDFSDVGEATAGSVTASCGVWMGAMVVNTDTGNNLVNKIKYDIADNGISDEIFYEYIGENAMKTVGVICTTDGTTANIDTAIKMWSMGKTSWYDVKGLTGTASMSSNIAMCLETYANRKTGNNGYYHVESTCVYARLQEGQTPSDACDGISGDILQPYNVLVNSDFSRLQPNSPICCSVGEPPNFMPGPKSNGDCYNYTITENETCESIMAKYFPLSLDDLMDYNKHTFGWMGCGNGHPWIGDNICLSSGSPPKPTVNPDAECGPQSPSGNDCPLNACCSRFGFCGYGDEFCGILDSPTGAPGTAGCLSNCESPSFGSPSASWVDIAYFDATKSNSILDYADYGYDIIHMAFANIASDGSSIDVSNIQGNFDDFAYLPARKVLSIGGWDFSTSQDTYRILRTAIEEDYNAFANVVVSFMQQPENQFLDGFDIDWEYPGEPDIPGIPPDNKDAGEKYLAFIQAVRLRMDSSKTLSIAIPSSYWYLKHFPIQDMMQYLDYVVFMTYDLHGQWDYSNKFSGGAHTSCHTNMPETEQALKMAIKAGIPPEKIRVGIANYARTYKLDGPCDGEGCSFVGPQSQALPGNITDTPGILSIDEIEQIIGSSPSEVDKLFTNATSECTYLRYDDAQWAAWSSDNGARKQKYQSWGFGGSSLWVANYNNSAVDSQDEMDDDYDDTIISIPLDGPILSSLNDDACWSAYQSISSFDDFNSTDDKCILEAAIAYLINAAADAVTNVTKLLNDVDYKAAYDKDYVGYSSYFAHNMSFAYQEWSYANVGNDDWFNCMDDKGNLISCRDAFVGNYKSPCDSNCCPGVGCSKVVDGVTERDRDKEQDECPAKSSIESCCVPGSSSGIELYGLFALTSDNSSDFYTSSDYSDIYNIAANHTNAMLDEGYVDFTQQADQQVQNESELIERRAASIYGEVATEGNTDFDPADYPDANINVWRVTSNEALDSFSQYVGYNVSADMTYIQPFYRFQQPQSNDEEHICWSDQHTNVTVRCYELPADRLLHRNPMQFMTSQLLANISGLIASALNAMDNDGDYHINIYMSILTPLAAFIDMNDQINSIQQIGHNYKSRCERLRVLQIIEPLLDVLSILTMFLGPEVDLIATLTTTLTELFLNPDATESDYLSALLGIAGGFFGVVGREGKGLFSVFGKERTSGRAFERTSALVSRRVEKSVCKVGKSG